MTAINRQTEAKVIEHWGVPGLRDRVAAVLADAGKDASNTAVEDLWHFDQLHVGDTEAIRRLADRIGVSADDQVLDVGSGLGGVSRLLAHVYGCKVTGVELTPSYVETAQLLDEVTGMGDRVSVQQGNAEALPFASETFDVVLTSHIAQSVPDKDAFFGEMARVLKPGGRFVIHDLYRGDEGVPCTYPAAWDHDGSITFVATAALMRDRIEREGLVVDTWIEVTQEAKDWTVAVIEAFSSPEEASGHEGAIPGLDFSLLFDAGEVLEQMRNSLTDVDSGAIGWFEATAHKPVGV